MSKKIDLQVRSESNYGKVTEFMRKKQIYTKGEVEKFLLGLGLKEGAVMATSTVMLSPRLTSKHGDCRGNMSNPWGAIAYNEKLARKVVDGVKEEQRFRFRIRAKALEAHRRSVKVTEVKSVKVVKTPSKVVTPATEVKSEVKNTAEATA